MTAPLVRTTTVDVLADALRTRILEGEIAAGSALREQQLAAEYGVARHTLRAALRALAAEGLVRIEPHRGARVTSIGDDELIALGELRIALETEAARLALARHGGLPPAVHAAQERLADACSVHMGNSAQAGATEEPAAPGRAGFAAVTEAHEALHHAIVRASGSSRIVAVHRALGGELRLFLVQLRPAWDVSAIAVEHAQLLRELERDGPDALRDHVRRSTQALLASRG